MHRIRLLVIDPMPLARKALTDALQDSRRVEVVATASGAALAGRWLAETQPDVIILDLQRPLAPEIEQLRSFLASWSLPVILFTDLDDNDRQIITTMLVPLRWLVLKKPNTNLLKETLALRPAIEGAILRIHNDSVKPTGRRSHAPPPPAQLPSRGAPDRLIALGASTGGTEAIATVLSELPRSTPGLVIVQHMPAGYTRKFADRLNGLGELEVREAVDGDAVRAGLALLAPGARQMTVAPAGSGYVVRIGSAERVNGHCPSINVLMDSVAEHAGRRGMGVLLTGMGDDGATGMKAIRDAGGGTIAQDEATSVVYGMPRAAVLCGGAANVAALPDVARIIVALVA